LIEPPAEGMADSFGKTRCHMAAGAHCRKMEFFLRSRGLSLFYLISGPFI
jgi:hypothetical protein